MLGKLRFIAGLALVLGLLGVARAQDAKPRIAFFPLAGDVPEELRDKIGLSLRAKLDRTGVYEVIDGPKMKDIAAEAKEGAVGYDAKPADVIELGKLAEASVLVWGEVVGKGGAQVVRVKVLDTREKDASPREVEKTIRQSTDLRFVSEEILQTLKGVKEFEHPNEEAVAHDDVAEEMWKNNPNLVENGDFEQKGKWTGIYQSEKYEVPGGSDGPPTDKVVIQSVVEGPKTQSVLAMKLSRTCAENNGMACLSEPIKILPDTRYRLSFRYKSDGPTLHVFVKGYTLEKNIKGEMVEREIYRRQVPPTGSTKGKWVTIVDEMNPQHVAFPVQSLRIDLYAYLSPGTVCFDDVVLKAVGRQTRDAKDLAIKRPVTRATTRP